jgi:hypothetical protein
MNWLWSVAVLQLKTPEYVELIWWNPLLDRLGRL